MAVGSEWGVTGRGVKRRAGGQGRAGWGVAGRVFKRGGDSKEAGQEGARVGWGCTCLDNWVYKFRNIFNVYT